LIYRERLPSPALRDYVERLWWLEGTAGEIVAEPIPPDGHPEIIVHGGDPFRAENGTLQERVLLAGQMTVATRVAPSGATLAVGARLRPDAAHALFGAPQWQLTDRVVDLRDLDARLALRIRTGVSARGRGEEMLDALDATLADYVASRRRVERRLSPAVRVALRSGGLVGVDGLARAIGVTPRQAERLFREHVGLPPKLFLRIVRFQRALAALPEAPRRSPWAELAVSLGYYDQSHLIRDFRELAGRAPGAWSAPDESLAAVFSPVRRPAAGPREEDVAFFQDAPGAPR